MVNFLLFISVILNLVLFLTLGFILGRQKSAEK